MIWILIGLGIFTIIVQFVFAVNKDKTEIKEIKLIHKYSNLIDTLNRRIFNGKAEIVEINNRTFNLLIRDSNSIVMFFYSTGHLTITWKKNSLIIGSHTFEKQLTYISYIDSISQIESAEIFYREGENFFSKLGLKGIMGTAVSSSEQENEDEDFLEYVDGFLIDGFAESLITIIDETLKNGHAMDDIFTSYSILKMMNEGVDSAKTNMRNNDNFKMDDEKIETIAKRLYEKLYQHYFTD